MAGKRGWVQGVFWSSVALSWVAVMFFAAELGTRLLARYHDSDNLYRIANSLKEPLLEVDAEWKHHNRDALAKFSRPTEPFNLACGEEQSASVLASEEWLRKFLDANETDRQLLAIMHDVGAVALSLDSVPSAAWGSWPVGMVQGYLNPASLPQSVGEPYHVLLQHTQQRGNERTLTGTDARLFIGEQGTVLNAPLPLLFFKYPWQPPQPALEPEDRWEIPWFKYMPNYEEPLTGLLKTNSRGFSDHETKLPKPRNTIRILCIGASTTNEGVDIESNYANQVEEFLNSPRAYAVRAPDTMVDVVNCGVEGITTDRILNRFSDYLALEPDLVMLLEGINDLAFQTLPSPLVRPSHPLRAYLARTSKAYNMVDSNALRPDPALLAESIRKSTVSRFEAFAVRMQQCGVPVVVCTVPSPDPDYLSPAGTRYFDFDLTESWQCPETTYSDYHLGILLLNEQLRDLAKRRGLLLIPLDRHFQGILGSMHIFHDICHMYPIGISIKARCVGNYLVDEMALLAERRAALAAAPQP